MNSWQMKLSLQLMENFYFGILNDPFFGPDCKPSVIRCMSHILHKHVSVCRVWRDLWIHWFSGEPVLLCSGSVLDIYTLAVTQEMAYIQEEEEIWFNSMLIVRLHSQHYLHSLCTTNYVIPLSLTDNKTWNDKDWKSTKYLCVFLPFYSFLHPEGKQRQIQSMSFHLYLMSWI